MSLVETLRVRCQRNRGQGGYQGFGVSPWGSVAPGASWGRGQEDGWRGVVTSGHEKLEVLFRSLSE